MKAELSKDKKELTVTIPVSPRPSKSGKTTVVASSNGNKPTTCEYKGKPVVIGVNAYVK